MANKAVVATADKMLLVRFALRLIPAVPHFKRSAAKNIPLSSYFPPTKMNDDLCRDFILHIDKDNSLQCGEAPDNIKTWLEGLKLPPNLLRFMRWYWPQSDCKIAHYHIFSSRTIYTHEVTPILLKFDLLGIGWALNGDWLVIDFSKEACVPGFIPFALWNPLAIELESPRTLFQSISQSFDVFLYRAMEGLFLPFDSYAAERLNNFLKETEQVGTSNGG